MSDQTDVPETLKKDFKNSNSINQGEKEYYNKD